MIAADEADRLALAAVAGDHVEARPRRKLQRLVDIDAHDHVVARQRQRDVHKAAFDPGVFALERAAGHDVVVDAHQRRRRGQPALAP